MKKKLLITLGCSFTEGVGCYDAELLKKYNRKSPSDMEKYYGKSIERFHKFGWPAQLQKKLNYDKLINLGKAGCGESYQLKRFIQEFAGVNLSKEYDVLVVWLTSPPGRLSFFVDGWICNIMSNWNHPDGAIGDMAKAYVNLIQDVDFDTALEQAFYIKTLKEICNGKNYNFLVFPLGTSDSKLHGLLNISENMGNYYTFPPYKLILPDIDSGPYASILNCYHPNEAGYELIADRMIGIINKYNSNLINNSIDVVSMEMEWRDQKKIVKII